MFSKIFSRLNSVFNFVFLITVFVLIAGFVVNNTLHIFSDNPSTEKRDLAVCPSFFKPKESSIKDYFASFATVHTDFEKCFGDNFSFRNKVIKWMNLGRLIAFDKPSLGNVTKGSNDWFFYNNKEYIDQVQGMRQYSDVERSKIKQNLQLRKDYFQKNNIEYQVIIVPSKLTIYPEYFGSMVKVSSDTLVESYTKIAQEVGYNITNLKPVLESLKSKERVFYSNDSHWNYDGMVHAYDILANQFDLIQPTSLSKTIENHYGDIPFLLNIFDYYQDRDQTKLEPKNSQSKPEIDHNIPFELKNRSKVEYQKWINKNQNLPKVVLFGDSFTDIMRPILAENFSELYFYKTQKDFPKEELDRINPDVVIYVFNEFQLVDTPEF
jgi:alginate O-acetyltransferase complex protein AlgJ